MQVKYVTLTPTAKPPTYATDGAACMDVYADTQETTTIPAGKAVTLPTGLAFEVPNGYAMLVYSRSGHGFKAGVRLSNAVGVLDSDYRGPLMVRLHNDSRKSYTVAAGERIAQIMVLPVPVLELVQVERLSDTARGAGGLGSTGTT